MLSLRRRFQYPCADIVSGHPSVDRAIDTALSLAHPLHRRPRLSVTRGTPTVAVLGFPRSGNTYIAHWLEWTALPTTRVLDGRLTHSALDVHRVARSSACVVLPVRLPLDTCASWLVRADAVSDAAFARDTLRSYAAWYATAARAVNRPNVVVSSFDVSTQAPWLVNSSVPVSTAARVSYPSDLQAFETWLHDQLRDVSGQGQDQDGVPSHQMISVPHMGRSVLLERASETLQERSLRRQLSAAVNAYYDLVAHAGHEGTLLSLPADTVERAIID